MKILTVQSSVLYFYLAPLRPKYLPQCPILENLLLGRQAEFHTIIKALGLRGSIVGGLPLLRAGLQHLQCCSKVI
jgi:hypothetical protein